MSLLSVLLLNVSSVIPALAQSDPTPKITVPDGDTEFRPPKLIRWAAAELSDEARAAHYRGVCLISLVVDTEGRSKNVRVVRPLGMRLDVNAIQAAKQFRFIPAMEHDSPIATKVTVEVHFKANPSSEKLAD